MSMFLFILISLFIVFLLYSKYYKKKYLKYLEKEWKIYNQNNPLPIIGKMPFYKAKEIKAIPKSFYIYSRDKYKYKGILYLLIIGKDGGYSSKTIGCGYRTIFSGKSDNYGGFSIGE